MFHSRWFPKIQRHAPPPNPSTLRQTLSKDAVRKRRLTLHVCCCLWPLPVSVGFTGSFTPACHASPHRRPLNTDPLYRRSRTWEEPSATHTAHLCVCVGECVCVSLFLHARFFHWWKLAVCTWNILFVQAEDTSLHPYEHINAPLYQYCCTFLAITPIVYLHFPLDTRCYVSTCTCISLSAVRHVFIFERQCNVIREH